MRILRVDPRAPDTAALAEAAAVVRGGGLVAFPTETVYGLGANALDAEAVRGIFRAKGRPSFNPLIAHAADAAGARALSNAWPRAAEALGARFWPGPLTLVVPRAGVVPLEVTAGLETVAVRVPAHPVARALLRTVGLPLAAPSANPYTAVSPTSAEHVARGLGAAVDLILDGGPTTVGIESTVLDLSGPAPTLLRPGSISLPELEAVIGPIGLPRSDDAAPDREGARRSPGMVDRHYSPRAELRLFGPGETEPLAHAVEAANAAGLTVGGLLLGREPHALDRSIRMPADPSRYARRLYAALHELDAFGCDLIVADVPPDAPAWAGVRDRLTRAAHRDPA